MIFTVCVKCLIKMSFNSMCFLAFHCKYLLKVFQKCKVSISLGLAQIEDFIKMDLLW